MKSVLMLLGSVVMVLAVDSIISPVGGFIATDQPVPLNPTQMELSHDNGPGLGFIFIYGAGVYLGAQFSLPSGGPWFLNGIKYYVENQGWPDSVYQGFAVGCWKFVGGVPGPVVWPTSGIPIYNPNTGGGWIVQQVQPEFNLTQNCPNGFLVGVGLLYNYPACDALGFSNTGVGPYDWACISGSWSAAPANPCIRALIDDEYPEAIEPVSLGGVRALYR